MARGSTRAMSEERWDKDIHPSNRFEARWAHPWWDVQSFQKNEAYQNNLAASKDFAKEVTDKWLPMFKEKGWIKPGDTLVEGRLEAFTKALGEHENFIKKVNALGDYLAVPISREDKLEKYLPLMKEGGEILDRMLASIRGVKHTMVVSGQGGVKSEIKGVNLEHKLPDVEAALYKKMTDEALMVPVEVRREQEAKGARFNRDYKRSRSKED